MAAATQRKGTRMVAAEKSRTVGSLRALPAGEELTPTATQDATAADVVGPAAMAEGGFAVQQSQGGATQVSGSGGGLQATATFPPPSSGGGGGSVSLSSSSGGLGNKFTSGSTPRVGDPDVSYAFSVTIDNTSSGMFSEVGGLSWKAESIPIRSGGNNEHGYHMRGPGKFEPLTLKRGFFAANDDFFRMLKGSLSPKKSGPGYKRCNVTVALLNRKYETIGEYKLKNAFIIEYTGLQLNSTGSQVGFEQVRFAYDYFEYSPK